MFENFFINQLRSQIGEIVEIATDNHLVEGVLSSVDNGLIELAEIIIGYERETRTVFIPLSAVNFVRAST